MRPNTGQGRSKEEAITTLKARIEEIEKLITDREADLIKLECQLKQSIAEKYPRGSATKLAGEFQRLEKNKSGNSQSKAANGEVNSCDTCKVENRQNTRKYLRKIWGLRKSLHVRQIEKHVIAWCANAEKLNFVRNFKRREGKDIWWVEVSGEEKILVELETMWKHDFWKIERVYSQPRLRPCAVRGNKQA